MAKHIQDIHGWVMWRLSTEPKWFEKNIVPYLVNKPGSKCICWTRKNQAGYGYKVIDVRLEDGTRGRMYIHRLFWVLKNKRNINKFREIDHTCEDKTCVVCLEEVTPVRNKWLRYKDRHTDELESVSEQGQGEGYGSVPSVQKTRKTRSKEAERV